MYEWNEEKWKRSERMNKTIRNTFKNNNERRKVIIMYGHRGTYIEAQTIG